MICDDQKAPSDSTKGGGDTGRHTFIHSHPLLAAPCASNQLTDTQTTEKKKKNHSHSSAHNRSRASEEEFIFRVCLRVDYLASFCAPHTHTPPDTPIFSPLISHQSHKHMFSFHSSSASTTWRGKCLGGILTCCLQLTGSG